VPAGIFVIRNKVNKRIYVGGSDNLAAAMNRARFELKMTTHRNQNLMNECSQYGAGNLVIEATDTLKARDDPFYDDESFRTIV
jgi:hypothetical protein